MLPMVFSTVGLPAEADTSAVRAAGLTDRETGILKALARGLSKDAIAKGDHIRAGEELSVKPRRRKNSALR